LDRLSQTTGDTQAPDRESLLDACGRKATPLKTHPASIPSDWFPSEFSTAVSLLLEFSSQNAFAALHNPEKT